MSAPVAPLWFEPDLEHQLRAIRAVADVLCPPGVLRPMPGGSPSAVAGNDRIVDGPLLATHLRAVQAREGLPLSGTVDPEDLQLTVSMETGTGKTYVFLRTIHTLHRACGLTKFIVVVPSVAIRAGVLQALRATAEHFAHLFAGTRIHAFVYDPRRLARVRGFASSPTLQVMVATVQALHRSGRRIFHQPREDLGYRRPIDLVRAARPVVIVDEPQSVEGGPRGKGREALQELSPLVTLRYSATHRDVHHMVYQLDAQDARDRGLVKSIAVASVGTPDLDGRPFVHLVAVRRQGRVPVATVEVQLEDPVLGPVRRPIDVRTGADLGAATGRAVYRGMRVDEVVYVRKRADRQLRLRVGTEQVVLAPGQAHGEVDLPTLHRQLVRRTIDLHLARRARLHPRGIKVLSLIFIDAVWRYRGRLGPAGDGAPGPLHQLFEEEYRAAVDARGGPAAPVESVHNGYFSRDRTSGAWCDTDLRGVAGRAAAAEAHRLIMHDKSRLLSLDTPLEFIFSHSALQEGWDNPNVFQICVLREMASVRQRRQVVGRGLRLCVGPDGRRVERARTEPDLNELTVVAPERVRAYAAGLQHEVEADTGVRFGRLEPRSLAHLSLPGADGRGEVLGMARAAELLAWLTAEGIVGVDGMVRTPPDLRALEDLPHPLTPLAEVVGRRLQARWEGLAVRDVDASVPAPVESSGMAALRSFWVDVLPSVDHRLPVDSDRLVVDVLQILAPALKLGAEAQPVPETLHLLQQATGLTRRTLRRVVHGSGYAAALSADAGSVRAVLVDAIRTALVRTVRGGLWLFPRGDGWVATRARPTGGSPMFERPVLPVGTTQWLSDVWVVSTPLGRFRVGCVTQEPDALHLQQLELPRPVPKGGPPTESGAGTL